jgi:nucleoside 2-deoxyribosyltransferase
VRIYLACTVRGDRGALAAARAVAERLKALGHEVLTWHLLDDDVEEAEARLTPWDVYARDVAWLESCDVIVAEASGSSYGVGFEVGYLLGRASQTDQEAVLCYDAARSERVSRLISGNAHPRCTTLAYRDVEELLAFVERRFA